MASTFLKSSLRLMVVASMLAACTPPAGTVSPGTNLQGLLSGGGAAAGLRYSQLKFVPADAAALAKVGQSNDRAPAAVGAPVPMPSAVPTTLSTSYPMNSPSYGSSYMSFPMSGAGWSGDDYELAETTQAKGPGFQGTLFDVQEKVVKGLVAEWASDARLRSASGATDPEGRNAALPTASPSQPSPADAALPVPYAAIPAPYIYYGGSQGGWVFNYLSPSRKEVLDITINSNETLVVKQVWRIRQVDLSTVKVNSNQAILIVAKAIQDRNAVTEEPRGMPTPEILENPASSVSGAAPSARPSAKPDPYPSSFSSPDPGYRQDEELFTVPAGARWFVSLVSEPKRQVWVVNMEPGPTPSSLPGMSYTSGAYARLDAQTGALISLNRPRQVFNGPGAYRRIAEPPTPWPVSLPTTTPEPVASPSV